MSNRYVLVVEDEPPNRRMLLRFLETLGHQAVAVENSDDALKAVAETMPAVVIADIVLKSRQGRDGLWLLEQIRQQWPALPVIMASGTQEEHIMSRAQELGASEFLPKPFTRESLEKALTRVLEP